MCISTHDRKIGATKCCSFFGSKKTVRHQALLMKSFRMCMLSCFSHVWLFAILWTVARQAPLCMGFSRQEYWNGLPCPLLGDLPHPGIEPISLTSPALAGGFFTASILYHISSKYGCSSDATFLYIPFVNSGLQVD